VIFLPILAKIWWLWKRPLDPCNQKCLLWIGRPQTPPVISNHVLAISHRNAFIATLVPKLVAMVTPLCSLCTGVSQMNSLMVYPIAKPNSAWICCIQLKLWAFCDIFAYFGQNLVAMATSLRPLQSEMSSLDCSTTKTPCYK